jgi:DNA-directed RNA polymerase sigma subunit (sigma70/sigma32)
MARDAAPPIFTAEPGLTHYLEEIRRFPMLQRQEEYLLAKRWREHGDRDAAHKLVTSHLRLVTKVARDYRGYGLPISEAISEGNVGLMQAVERFEPEKGFRFATYAVWWIKAAIVLASVSTTAFSIRYDFSSRCHFASLIRFTTLFLSHYPAAVQSRNGINRRMIWPTGSPPYLRTGVCVTSSDSSWLVRLGPIASNRAFCSSVNDP